VISYAVQIYCDFSGYSDMAIGAARCMGYDFAENFRHPYIATSLSDFWQRWHISLSSWLRDYLYIPLGGNRHGAWKTYRNLLVTMLLGGLWHGAAWTFVVWGAIHGGALALWRFVSGFAPTQQSERRNPAQTVLGWFVTMQIVLVAWVFFRSQDFSGAMLILRQMYLPQEGIVWHPPSAPFAVLLIVLTHGICATSLARLRELPHNKLYTPVILCLLVWLVVVFRPTGFQPFIYFQF
jgi:alginate O-acetyltransferase complex protein AlgI